jgi:hypothetical protein
MRVRFSHRATSVTGVTSLRRRPPRFSRIRTGSNSASEHFKPYARWLNCDAAGLAELELPKRADSALFKQLERTKAPLVYRWRQEGGKVLGGEPLGRTSD